MKNTKCIVDKNYVIDKIDNRIYGSFIEHLGRAVYTGIYEPGHPTSDEYGFRKDVIELVKELNVPIVRYPGGNFVSGYNWTDGIGPKAERPRRLELAWYSIETNEMGIDEFADWSKKANTEVMAAVNLGTGTPQEAGNMVEYCNHPSGTYWSDLRRKYGHNDPHNIKVWCLGNEMDGPWQICHLSPDDYGKKALEAAKIMKWVDPTIELVACGSSNSKMPTYPEWDRVVLEHLYDKVDYISMHRYYYEGENGGTTEDFLASFVDMDRFIHTIASVIDYVKAKNRSSKTLKISFDEWNVWYQNKRTRYPWEIAPPILEDNYSLLDALVVGGLMCTLVNNADKVKMACLAQLVNVIAPIFTEKGGRSIRQTIFYPFKQVSNYARGVALKPIITTPKFETALYGDAPTVQMSVTFDEENDSVCIFVLNCDRNEDMQLSLDLRSFGNIKIVEHVVLDGEDLYATNTFDNPENIKPRNMELPKDDNNTYDICLPKTSWNMIRFSTR
jgi:alpha-N-arabinofuranosidase